MLVERVKYKDFDGNEREEKFYFNFTEAELTEMELSTKGGLKNEIQRIMDSQDQSEIIKIFKNLLLKAYGVKSPDGKRFIKDEQLTKEFEQTNAYSQLFMKLAFDDEAAAKWINGVIPQEIAKELDTNTTPALTPVNN